MKSLGAPFIALSVLALLAVTASAVPVVQEQQQLGEKIDAIVQREMDNRSLPGVSIAVVNDGEIVYARGYGYANLELAAPAMEETVYLIGSVTKPFTSMAIMKLVEEGLVSLDDPITKFFENIPQEWSEVTVLQLLHHTSGIKSYTGIGEMWLNQHNEVTGEHIVSMAAEHELEFEPGEGWNYNNTGYVMLGMIIEKVSETSYEEYLRLHIFEPLGMLSSGYNSWKSVIPNRASGYSREDGFVNAQYLSMSWPFSAGALFSSAEDLARWVIAMDNHDILSEESYEALYGNSVNIAELSETSGAGPGVNYGLGWLVSEFGEKTIVSHGGGINGFNSEVMRIPEDRFAVIVLVNTDGGASPIASAIREIFYPSPERPEPEAIDDDNAELTAMLKTFLENALKGEIDRSKLTDEFSASLPDELIPSLVEVLGGSSVGELALLESRQMPDDMLMRRYAVQIGSERVQFTAAINAEGKIAGLQIQPL